MKTFFLDIIPKLKAFSLQLDIDSLLVNKNWVLVSEGDTLRIVYIFRSGGELLISKQGRIERGKWESISSDTLLLESESGIFLFRHGFIDSQVLALKLDGSQEYALFVNELLFNEINATISCVIKYLNESYLELKQSEQTKEEIVNLPEEKFEIQEGQNFLSGTWIGVDHRNQTIIYTYQFSDGKLFRSANYENMFPVNPLVIKHEVISPNHIRLHFSENGSPRNTLIKVLDSKTMEIGSDRFQRSPYQLK